MQLSEQSANRRGYGSAARVVAAEKTGLNKMVSRLAGESLAIVGDVLDRRGLATTDSACAAAPELTALQHQALIHKTNADILYQIFDRAYLSASQRQTLAPLEDQLHQLNFQPLGSLTTSRFANRVIHAYVHTQWSINAIVWQSDALRPIVDLYSTFRDGSNLTTSSMPGKGDRPQQQIFGNSYPAGEPDLLLSRHRDRLAILHQENGLIRPACQQLKILALALEEYCQRQPSGFWHGVKNCLSQLGFHSSASTVEPL